MLNVHFGRRQKNCEGTSRRSFLQVGSLAGGLTLADLLASRVAAAESQPESSPVADTSVIWLWLNGGPTHVETFDPKMTAPVEFRSVTGELKTRLPGITLGGNFPGLAKLADKMVFVRSFTSGSSSHNRGCFRVNTGYPSNANRPSLGSITSRFRGANHTLSGMPTYVGMGRIGFGSDPAKIAGPAWLGKAYSPFEPGGQTSKDMKLSTAVSRLDDRRSLLSGLDRLHRDAEVGGLLKGLDGLNQQALSLILGKAPQAFDLAKEDPRVVARYGGGLGASLLTARRLCEAGCGFVTVSLQGWDMHGGIKKRMDSLGPQVDRAASALIDDLHQSGLDKKILFVITGEFGRTPRINKNSGRDHWGPLSTLALAGGGLRMGQAIGTSSAKAERPATGIVQAQDLMATVFHVLGMGPDTYFTDQSGRPIPMLQSGRLIPGLI